jgi:hypothetical protein
MKKTAQEKRQNKNQAKIDKAIAKANAMYKKATASQRRVMIAKDVIKRLNTRQIKAVNGSFTKFGYDSNGRLDGANVQEVLHNPKFATGITSKKPVCNVCGIGGLFLSAVSFRNKFQLNEYGSTYANSAQAVTKLSEFSHKQKQLIEMAFEQGNGWFTTESCCGNYIKSTPAVIAARGWREKYFKKGTSKTVLIALCRNIIRHGGWFNPMVK